MIKIVMETLKIDIINPKARKLLKDLAELNLIAIRESKESSLKDVLRTLRSDASAVPGPVEIAHEVEAVRARRYNK